VGADPVGGARSVSDYSLICENAWTHHLSLRISVVVTEPFIKNLLHNHSINIKK
jgi:hypothetical protein